MGQDTPDHKQQNSANDPQGFDDFFASLTKPIDVSAIHQSVENVVRAPNAPKIEEVSSVTNLEKMQNTAEETLATMGDIQRKFEVPGANRLLICVRQNHGSLSEIQRAYFSSNFQKLSAWFSHQNQIVSIQRSLDEVLGPLNVHFFLEGLSRNDALFDLKKFQDPQKISIIRQNENGYREAAESPEMAAWTFRALFNTSIDRWQNLLLSYMGMRRYMNLFTCDQSENDIRRFSGLDFDRDIATLELARTTGDISLFKKARIDDAKKLNEYASQKINADLQKNHCGVVILGSLHFADEAEYLERCGGWDDYNPEFPMYRTDKYLTESGILGKTNVLVFEPNTLERSL